MPDPLNIPHELLTRQPSRPPVAWKFPALLVALAISLGIFHLFFQFRGLSNTTAMDQAQIARQLAMGKGFSTLYIRPLAIWQLQNAGKKIPADAFPDFSQSPLNPLVNALPLKWVEASWKLLPTDLIYIGDRMIAGVAILLFLVSTGIWGLLAARLFGKSIAFPAVIIVLLCDLLWQFSMSGLPQMLLLFLLSLVCLLTLEAIEKPSRRLPLLFLCGLLFGLMMLAHGIAAGIFAGWLVFVFKQFHARIVTLLVPVFAASLITLPWLMRNDSVCGNAFGLAGYELIAPVNSAESGYLRSLTGPPSLSSWHPAQRIKEAVFGQGENLFSFLGMNIVAAVFFVSLLHRFSNQAASGIRLCALLMWIGGALAMGLCGVDGIVSSNQLHSLFIPLFVIFGFAFLAELWGRLEWNVSMQRGACAAVIILCSLPLLSDLLAGPPIAVQWPPYVPPFIAVLGEWFGKDEAIATDMPWATAWYAGRKSLLLPETIKDFNRISDFRTLGGPLSGLYLTPITGNRRLFSEIYKGPYTEWVFQITRPPSVEGFPLKVFTPLPIDGECILFSDRDRWSRREK